MLRCNFFIDCIVHWIFQLGSTSAEACENSQWITMSCWTAAVMKVLCQKVPSTFLKYASAIAFILELEIEVFLELFSNLCFSISSLFIWGSIIYIVSRGYICLCYRTSGELSFPSSWTAKPSWLSVDFFLNVTDLISGLEAFGGCGVFFVWLFFWWCGF